jgi:hypothetical protein
MTHTTTHVIVHAWAETDVLAKDEYPGVTGMPRDGDECCFPYCTERMRAGDRAVAIIEVPREERVHPMGEAWVGYEHPLHVTWRDGMPS